MADNAGSDIRFHEEIEAGELSQIEQYQKLMHANKQLIYELKIGIISIIGGIAIVACIIYVVCSTSVEKKFQTNLCLCEE